MYSPPPCPAHLEIEGDTRLFPVRRVYCVGRNYAAHAREMGFNPEREPPFFFCKPNDAQSVVIAADENPIAIPYPSLTHNLHHEVELVVALGKPAYNITPEQASDCIFGYAVGLDMTRRDLQIQMREQGRPWEIGKAFDYSAPIGRLSPAAQCPDISQATIELRVNEQVKQSSKLSQLIWSVPEVIANLSTLFALQAGDIIMTGTPEGVGAVERGDALSAHITGLPPLFVKVA